ncbi:protein-tyrosine-phosphatase [Maribacter algicola]|uniref:Protein-tyrosine-phosphatase n=1 Tax=Maribacter algicola TaxID=2498892 RepID=A0A426RES6_9FLAO|nr:protein-tyrosine-phosphatase [Maribacter algicola]RRQ47491.1 protein-tyrosine-phosphatase [Maribacter algicola]
MFNEIKECIEGLNGYRPDADRLRILQILINFIQEKKDKGENIDLNFVCTHNSRRSHLSQIWAQTIAAYFEIPNVYCYSGGTEATALFPKIAETLVSSGFKISKLSDGNNPIYSIKYGANSQPIIGFSKTYDHSFNPESNFSAIMTCGHADENCPYIPGAERRIPLTFNDPKAFDGTEQQTEKYMERSLEIASQLYYIFSKIV